MSKKCDYIHFALPIGIFFLILYLALYFWGNLATEAAVKELHFNLMKFLFLGFNGFNGYSFLLGAVQSFIWGLIFAGVFYWTYLTCPCQGCEIPAPKKK